MRSTEAGMTNSLESRANDLVNPNSGIANDYLNHFNEILLLIENLPILLPEMLDEMLAWKPVGYREYFTNSALPGRQHALEIYNGLDAEFRQEFESMVRILDAIVVRSIELVTEHRSPDGTLDPDGIEDICEQLAADMHIVFNRTADLVNFGYAAPLRPPQEIVDRILSSKIG
jgi:hypothetical protein